MCCLCSVWAACKTIRLIYESKIDSSNRACITSMVRLKYLGDFATSTDLTWDNTIGIMVSIIEICVAMICE